MGLMKVALIDDLVCDIYAKIYEDVVPMLREEDEARTKSGIQQTETGDAAPGHPLLGQLQQHQSTPEPQTTKSRAKGVGRREILRKAELCANRPATMSAATTSSRASAATGPTLGQTVQVIISQSNQAKDGDTGASTPAGSTPPATGALGALSAATGRDAGSTAPSHRGSIYESAFGDDESGSELSEPPEDLEGEEPDFDDMKDEPEPEAETEAEPTSALFPNLAKAKAEELMDMDESSTRNASPGAEVKGEREDGDGDTSMAGGD